MRNRRFQAHRILFPEWGLVGPKNPGIIITILNGFSSQSTRFTGQIAGVSLVPETCIHLFKHIRIHIFIDIWLYISILYMVLPVLIFTHIYSYKYIELIYIDIYIHYSYICIYIYIECFMYSWICTVLYRCTYNKYIYNYPSRHSFVFGHLSKLLWFQILNHEFPLRLLWFKSNNSQYTQVKI